MMEIEVGDEGVVRIRGRLDAAQAPRAQEVLDRVAGRVVVDMADLDYISSAGLGVLLRTHKRLLADGMSLKLINVNKHISDIFTYSGFDRLFDIDSAGGAE